MQLLTVRHSSKPTRWYIDGKRVTQTAYDEARTGKTLDSFITTFSAGITRHFVSARTPAHD